jgi:hypothetical protein
MRVDVRGGLRSFVLSGAAILVFSVFTTPTASAADVGLEIPIDTVIRDDPGTAHVMASHDVDPSLLGRQCNVSKTAMNQHSVHPENDLIVRSGDTESILRDIESEPNATVVGEGTLVLGDEIVVSLLLGPDGVFSATLSIVLDCQEPEPGRIIVVKEVTEGSSTSQEFEFSTSFDDGFSLSHSEQSDSGALDAGIYSVSEGSVDGWTLQSAVCDDDSNPDAIDLVSGETVTCTFINDELPPDEVDAAIVVAVAGGCEVVDGEPVGQVTASIPVPGGAEIVITDSDGEVVETFTEDGTVTVPEGQYTWEATPADGFVFPEGFESSGTLTVICDQVLASIVVTVGSECEVIDGEGVGRVAVVMSVAGGADVVIEDSNGDIVGSLDRDGTVTVPDGASYTWAATPAEGFEFPAGTPDNGIVNIDFCSGPEVLPFTGFDNDRFALVGVVMLLGGGLTLLASTIASDTNL